MDFLNHLPISQDEREKLAKLGADTPFKLLALRKASKEAFDNYIGHDRAQSIAETLLGLVSEDERELLRAPPQRPGKLGARLDKPGSDK